MFFIITVSYIFLEILANCIRNKITGTNIILYFKNSKCYLKNTRINNWILCGHVDPLPSLCYSSTSRNIIERRNCTKNQGKFFSCVLCRNDLLTSKSLYKASYNIFECCRIWSQPVGRYNTLHSSWLKKQKKKNINSS